MAGEGTVVGRISIKVTPLLRDFWADLKKAIEEAEASLKGEIKFKAKLDTDNLRAEAAAAAKAAAQDVKMKVKVNADKSDFAQTLAEVKAAARDANVKVGIDFQDAAAEARLAELIAKLKAEAAAANIKLKVDTDRRRFTDMFSGAGGGFTPNLGGLSGLTNFGSPSNLIALAALLPAALSLVSASLLSLPALFTAVAAPIGVFALGIKGVKDALSASGLMDVVFGKAKKDGTPGKEKDSPGEVIQKLQQQISDVFRTGLTPVFQNFANALPAITAKLPDIARGIVDIFGGIGNALTSPAAIQGIQQLSTNIGNLLSGMAPGIQTFIESLGRLATGVSNHFPGLANFFNSIADKFGGFVDKLTAIGPDGKSKLDSVISNLKPALEGIFDIFKDLFKEGTKLAEDPNLAGNIKTVLESIKNFVVEGLPALQKIFQGIADAMNLLGLDKQQTPKGPDGKPPAYSVTPGGQNKSDSPFDIPEVDKFFNETLPNMGKTAWEKVKGFFERGQIDPDTAGQGLINFDGIGEKVSSFFTTTLPGVLSAAGAVIGPYWDQLFAGVSGALSTAGNEISNFFTVTIPSLIGQAGAGLSGIWDGITAGASEAWNGVVATVQGAWNTVVSTVSGAVDQVVSFCAGLPGRIAGALGNLGGLLVGAGRAAMEGLLSGIKAGAEAVYTFVSGIAAKIASLKGPLPYDRRVLTPNGMALMQGLQDGLEGGFEGVLSRTKQLADQLSQAVKDGLDISGSKGSIQQQLKQVQLEMDQLRVQRDALDKKDPQRKVIQGQMDQLNAAKDQLKLQSDNLGYAQKYGAQTDSTSQAAQMITQALAKMLDAAKSLVMGPTNQLMSDLGISGQGAIPSIANAGIDWGMQAVNGMVQGAFGQGKGQQGGTTIQVTNDESALAMKRTLDAREMQQYVSR